MKTKLKGCHISSESFNITTGSYKKKTKFFFKFSAVQAPQLHCHKSANKIIVTLLFYIYLGLQI